jgi:hypothetical protein
VKEKLIYASPQEDLLATRAVGGPTEKALHLRLRRTATAVAPTSSAVSEARRARRSRGSRLAGDRVVALSSTRRRREEHCEQRFDPDTAGHGARRASHPSRSSHRRIKPCCCRFEPDADEWCPATARHGALSSFPTPQAMAVTAPPAPTASATMVRSVVVASQGRARAPRSRPREGTSELRRWASPRPCRPWSLQDRRGTCWG